ESFFQHFFSSTPARKSHHLSTSDPKSSLKGGMLGSARKSLKDPLLWFKCSNVYNCFELPPSSARYKRSLSFSGLIHIWVFPELRNWFRLYPSKGTCGSCSV